MDCQLLLYDCADAPSARRARMFVAEKRQRIASVDIDVRTGKNLEPDYLAINPNGLVPALRTRDGEIITENDGIAAYLEAIWPLPALLGTSAIERGRIAQWNARIELEGLLPLAAFIRNGHPAFETHATPGRGSFGQIPELVDRSRTQVEMFLPQLDAQLAEQEFVAGSAFSLADITGIVFADLAEAFQLLTPDMRRSTAAWMERMRMRASYKLSF